MTIEGRFVPDRIIKSKDDPDVKDKLQQTLERARRDHPAPRVKEYNPPPPEEQQKRTPNAQRPSRPLPTNAVVIDD